jgi:hypothetical protein
MSRGAAESGNAKKVASEKIRRGSLQTWQETKAKASYHVVSESTNR